MIDSPTPEPTDLGEIEKYDFHEPEHYVFRAHKGLDRSTVEQISGIKDEPQWMRDFRLRSFDIFQSKPTPTWGGKIDIDYQELCYYIKPSESQAHRWEDVPSEIRETFDRLGIPEAEKKFLAGVKAQYESEVVYGSLQKDLEKQGVLFCDTDTALKAYPELFREYFGQIVRPEEHKFAALNSAVWSGGSFIYVPPGVNVDFPLQAYFRINAEQMGQFERTLIIVDEGRCRYTTIQNWANNIYNLVTKRAVAQEAAVMEWVDGNLGSRLTMKYPCVHLIGPGAHTETLSVAIASAGQYLDAGAKAVHAAPNTTSHIVSKSVSRNGGRSSYRGLVHVEPCANGSRSNVVCDALILDPQSRSDTYPVIEVGAQDVSIGHEATVSRVNDEQLFYLISRGLSASEANTMIVNGFIEPLVRELPMEYAIEMNRLIRLHMEGNVG